MKILNATLLSLLALVFSDVFISCSPKAHYQTTRGKKLLKYYNSIQHKKKIYKSGRIKSQYGRVPKKNIRRNSLY